MINNVKINETLVGPREPVYFIAEIGINHNGDINIAKKLIDAAVNAGCNAVKFQKRTPDTCVPDEQKNVLRETPWGKMKYIDYRYRVEFGLEEYLEIDQYCKNNSIDWFASCWDIESVDFINQFSPPCYKIASAVLTDDELLIHHRKYNQPIILSTGMSTLDQINHAIATLGKNDLILLHSTSTYPAGLEELNLKVINTFYDDYKLPVGYSGHEVGLSTTVAAATLGACVIERHITLDRSMWGTDQAASVEPQGLSRLVRDIRAIEKALGDGKKIVYNSEKSIIKKLRKV